jgi:EAL domain-containing protein (putative c-di-GMP-specific phosphodiesterase class I)
MGIALAIDDFGTGYSSLASLQNLPIGRCKIDQSFVEDIRSGPDGAAMAAAVVGIGRHLKLLVTAEGVETAEQATSLRALGCDDVQGFLYGHPMSAEAVSALLPGANAQG